MMTFDRALPELIRVCSLAEDEQPRRLIGRYAVVRDVRGRLRLVIDQEVPEGSVDTLEQQLVVALGNYFAPPILSSQGREDLRGLARKILEMTANKWPDGWPRSVRNLLGGADKPIEAGARWTGIERTIGKDAWLSMAPPGPPWPLLKGQTPPIVTFHSFKGGVGRTTLVAAHAIRLASQPKPTRVAIVDLDMEAPGIGELFGVQTERGTLDILIDHIATGETRLDRASALAQIDAAVDPRITIFPAGRVDGIYLQKLARLDFSSAEPGADNPVGIALTAMLKQMKASYDVILLDSRAGLHDLAGMSLHGLAHVDVLAFRGTSQNMAGLEQTLRTLGRRSDTRIVLAETLLPNDEELLRKRSDRTRDAVYDLMCEHIYEEDNPPQIKDVGEPHDIIPLQRREWLDGIDSLRGQVSNVLNETGFAKLTDRINDECKLSTDVETEADSGEEERE